MGGGFFLCPVSDLFLMEDEVALLQGFGDEGLVFFGGVAQEGETTNTTQNDATPNQEHSKY